uniref:Uncharacterized protein n=1 Tax=Molossus molossus TaxID=27622 RepID=A0A7J8HH69_MOLMO|nr:hypothetical protein HJG59_011005 [Molossus molossus]
MAGRGAINAGAEQTLPSRRRSVPRFAGRWPLRALGKAETNPPGSEKAGARQQDAQLTKKGGLLVRVCLWQTDGATAARRLAHQAGKTIFCPNKRLRRGNERPPHPGTLNAGPFSSGWGNLEFKPGFHRRILCANRPDKPKPPSTPLPPAAYPPARDGPFCLKSH